MGKQITLDYNDIVGGFYMSLQAHNLNGLSDKHLMETAKWDTKQFFDYVEKWQESGLSLESVE